MQKIGWEFPSTNGGREDGLNDSGISYFQANPIKSLTREVIQDSLDARDEEAKPVIVEFKHANINQKNIPGIKDLIKIFEQASSHYKESANETYQFFKKGYKALQQEEISVLAIRDRNTTGLTNITETKNSHFHRLTKTTGDTAKSGTSNGSFGIGKHAPFAASIIRTMFYGTLNKDKKEPNRGFQGVIKIASFDRGEKYLTQGTGFYGYKNDFLPLTDLNKLHTFFKREDGDCGTDKFILGFDDPDSWKEIVTEESVSNYMWAIYNGSLEVVVDDIVINANTLSMVVDKIQLNNPKSTCLEFYLTLTSPEKLIREHQFKTVDGNIETMKLFLLRGEGFNKKISLIRGTGMKIYEKGHFRTSGDFAGTLIVEGQRLNEVVRKMEPPTHDDWKPELYKENKAYAKKLKEELYNWLRNEVREINPKIEKDSFELPGLASILPSLDQEEKTSQEIDLSSDSEKIKSIVVVSNSMNENPKKRKRGGNNRPGKSKNNKKATSKPRNKETKAIVKNMRTFCLDESKGLYKLIVNPSTSGEALLEIKIVGESLIENANIYQAIEVNTGKEVHAEGNVIGPLSLLKGEVKNIHLRLDNTNRYSLGVISK